MEGPILSILCFIDLAAVVSPDGVAPTAPSARKEKVNFAGLDDLQLFSAHLFQLKGVRGN